MGTSDVGVRQSLKKSWTPSEEAFRKFLAWLDEGADSNGERYLDMRRRLVAYFDRKRCLTPDELADETLNRVARRLEEEGAIIDAPPLHYCYIVARFVFLEHLRSADHLLTELGSREAAAGTPVPDPEQEKHLDCLERCLATLGEEDRTLILGYYSAGSGGRIHSRRALAAQLGATPNALAIRACRIRAKLETCVAACVDEADMDRPLSSYPSR